MGDNGLDPRGGLGGVSCAPLALGSPRWYNAWAGPIWHVNATAYGHVDCLDDAVLNQKANNLALLEDPSHFSLDVVLQHDRKGLKEVNAGCKNIHGQSQKFFV